MAKKVEPGLFSDGFTERAFGERVVSLYYLFLAQAFARAQQPSLGQPGDSFFERRSFRGRSLKRDRGRRGAFSAGGGGHSYCGHSRFAAAFLSYRTAHLRRCRVYGALVAEYPDLPATE